MKKIIGMLSVFIYIFAFTTMSLSAASTYDGQKAKNFAYNNYDTSKELCAGFVSDCVIAGGSTISKQTLVGDLARQLSKNGFKQYTLKARSGKHFVSDNPYIEIGDVIIWYCPECDKHWKHAGIVTKFKNDVIYYTQTNPRLVDQTLWVQQNMCSHDMTLYCYHYEGTNNNTEPAGKIVYENVYLKSVSDTTAYIRADVICDVNLYKEAGVYWGTSENLGEKIGFDTSKNNKLTFIEVAFDGSEGPILQKGTTYYYQFYAIRNDGTVDKDSTIRSFTTTGDAVNPIIEEAYITDLDYTGYNIVCKVSDNVGVVRIAFPTWTAYNDQDDIAFDWYNNEAIVVSGNGTYTYRIDTSKHNNEYGIYHTHIYAYDAAGNYSIYHLNNNDVPRYMPFTDVKPSAWYFNTIADVYEKGFMSGKSEETFDPNAKITRGEVTSVIYNIENKPFVSYVGQFPDVPDGAWYTKPIIWAYRNSIVSGYGNGKFGVSDNVTREQLAKMLYSYAQFKGYDMSYNENAISSYADSAKVSKWAQPAMNWAISKGIMSGKGNAGADLSTYRLDPLGTATRAECASMINKFSELK